MIWLFACAFSHLCLFDFYWNVNFISILIKLIEIINKNKKKSSQREREVCVLCVKGSFKWSVFCFHIFRNLCIALTLLDNLFNIKIISLLSSNITKNKIWIVKADFFFLLIIIKVISIFRSQLCLISLSDLFLKNRNKNTKKYYIYSNHNNYYHYLQKKKSNYLVKIFVYYMNFLKQN